MERKILINGKIYTENKLQPWAEAVAIEDKHFACVGSTKEVRAYAKFHWGEDFETVDLSGRTVLPGLIEGHTHPAMMSKTAWVIHDENITNEDEMYESIKKYAALYPKEKRPYFVFCRFHNEWYGPEGPNNKRLNEIINDRPARIEDNSGHGCLYNDIALEMLKDENGIPRNSSLVANFVKDANGNYTGWAQQALAFGDTGVYEKCGFQYPDAMSDELSTEFLDTFRHYGITVCMDGITETDGDLQYLCDKDRKGELNMHYEATSTLSGMDEASIEQTISRAKRWQKQFTTDHIRCNTVKYFMDGSIEFGDVLSTEPFSNDPEGKNCGFAHCTPEEMTNLLVRLNKERLDIHIHCVCDGSLRVICDACEAAQKICGDDWCIYVTVAHCETIHPNEIHRIHQLGMFMDTTPAWSGGASAVDLPILGLERWKRMYDYSKIIADGEHVGFSSDVIEATEAYYLNPFTGIQFGITRFNPFDIEDFDYEHYYEDGVRPPKSACLTLEQMIHGYSVTNAIRMRLIDRLGSIEVGKDANLIVLRDDIFTTPADKIMGIEVDFTYFEGKELHAPNPVPAGTYHV